MTASLGGLGGFTAKIWALHGMGGKAPSRARQSRAERSGAGSISWSFPLNNDGLYNGDTLASVPKHRVMRVHSFRGYIPTSDNQPVLWPKDKRRDHRGLIGRYQAHSVVFISWMLRLESGFREFSEVSLVAGRGRTNSERAEVVAKMMNYSGATRTQERICSHFV